MVTATKQSPVTSIGGNGKARTIDLTGFAQAALAATMMMAWNEDKARNFCNQNQFDYPPEGLEEFCKQLTTAAHAIGAPPHLTCKTVEGWDALAKPGHKKGKTKKEKAPPPPAPVPNPEDYKGKDGRKKLQEAVKEAEELEKLPNDKTDELLVRLTEAWAKKHEEELAALKIAGRTPRVSAGGLNGTEIRVLTALSKSAVPLTRLDLSGLTGIKKGWSKLLGATTKGEDNKGLTGRGLVAVVNTEESRSMAYRVTDAGTEALAKANAV